MFDKISKMFKEDPQEKKKREELAGDLLNAHNGILYHVKFTILGGGNIEGLLGELHEFKPVAGDRLPEPR